MCIYGFAQFLTHEESHAEWLQALGQVVHLMGFDTEACAEHHLFCLFGDNRHLIGGCDRVASTDFDGVPQNGEVLTLVAIDKLVVDQGKVRFGRSGCERENCRWCT